MHYNATKSGDDVLDKLVREYTCKKSTRRWPLKLFLKLIDVACVNAFVLWMLIALIMIHHYVKLTSTE
jgi:hypothetical protein